MEKHTPRPLALRLVCHTVCAALTRPLCYPAQVANWSRTMEAATVAFSETMAPPNCGIDREIPKRHQARIAQIPKRPGRPRVLNCGM